MCTSSSWVWTRPRVIGSSTTTKQTDGNRGAAKPSRIGKLPPAIGNEMQNNGTTSPVGLTRATSLLTEQSTSLLTGDIIGVTPTDAWTKGTNIRTAMKIDEHHKKAIRLWIVTEVGRLCKMVDANKTLSSDEELKMCCRAIVDDFPALKLEEVRTCFDMIIQGKFGKLYERLKTAEILECLRKYEGDVRAPILERQMQNRKYAHVDRLTHALSESNAVQDAVKKMEVSEPKKPKDSGLGQRVKKHLGTDE